MVKRKSIFQILELALDDKRFVAFIILLALLTSFLIQTASAAAANDVPSNGYCSGSPARCYAEIDWYHYTGGAYTNISPYGSMSCANCPTYAFIDNEMWLTDKTSSQCKSVGACWVESGISTWSPSTPDNCKPGYASTCLFWADNRPNGGGYHQHSLWPIGLDGANLNPWGFDVTIENFDSDSPSGSEWEVIVDIYQNNSFVTSVLGISTNNSMSPNDISVGSELSAHSGASASKNDFLYNQLMAADGSGNWSYQTNPNSTLTNNPPYGQWYEYASPGGMWETWDD